MTAFTVTNALPKTTARLPSRISRFAIFCSHLPARPLSVGSEGHPRPGGAGPPGPRPPARKGDGQTQSSGLGSGVSSCRSDRKPVSPQPHLLTNEIQKNQTKRTKPTTRTPPTARSPLVGRSASLGPASGARERRLPSRRDQPARRLVGFENSNHSQTTLGHSSTC